MQKRVLAKAKKEIHEPIQRISLSWIVCKSEEKCCKMVINNGSIDNLVSTKMVEKIGLQRMAHPTPYKES